MLLSLLPSSLAEAPSPFPVATGVQLKLLPCRADLPLMRINLSTAHSHGTLNPTFLAVAGPGNNTCLSCPGENGKETDACHTWGCKGLQPDEISDRNDEFLINTTDKSKPFWIYTFPKTDFSPIGPGLMAPGQCLVPTSSGGQIGDSILAKQCNDNKIAQKDGLWVYDSKSLQLRHNNSGLCLDAGSPFAINCWDEASPTFDYPMCNFSLLAEDRARDFVSRMSLAEKGHNLGGAGGWGGSAGVPRLGIQGKMALQSSEALHGLGQASCGEQRYYKEFGGNNTGCPASFPHAQALGSTFNRSLWGLIGDRISTEARAAFNTGHLQALWLWAPDINLFKDPRWGRGQEVPGEDPFLNGEYAVRWIRAFEYGVPESEGGGGTTEHIKALATAKHAFDYDLENWGGFDRSSFNAVVSDHDQVAYYWPAWRAAVQGGAAKSVMCSYNAVNGVPSCANDLFLNDVMREEWGFDGLVVSDCGAIQNIKTEHHYRNSSEDACAAGVMGGCDADCPGGDKNVEYFKDLQAAVTGGQLQESALDASLVRLWTAAIRLGLFDDPNESAFSSYTMAAVADTPATRRLNTDAAVQAMVLLKNDAPAAVAAETATATAEAAATAAAGVAAGAGAGRAGAALLPVLDPKATFALIGPHFNSTQDLLSDYCPGHWWARSPLMAAQDILAERLVGYEQGCGIDGTNQSGIAGAVALAKKADVAVVVVGLTASNDPTNSGTPPVYSKDAALETEGHDRTDIVLPGVQEDLIKAVVAANPRTVVVLIHGGTLAIEWTKDNVPAILDAHYPGQMGGDAIWKTLLNLDGAAPAGRLTTTAYKADFVSRNMTDMSLHNITYKYYTGETLFAFGFGLSYSKFSVEWNSTNTTALSVTVTTDEMLSSSALSTVQGRGGSANASSSPAAYTAMVTNVGNVASDYVLLGFVSNPGRRLASLQEPIRELFDFARVSLAPGESTSVMLSIPATVLARVTSEGEQVLTAGEFIVQIGDENLGDMSALETSLRVIGEDRTLFSLPAVRARARARANTAARKHTHKQGNLFE